MGEEEVAEKGRRERRKEEREGTWDEKLAVSKDLQP